MTVVVIVCSHSSVHTWLDVSTVHLRVNKPGANGRVSYDSLTHSRESSVFYGLRIVKLYAIIQISLFCCVMVC